MKQMAMVSWILLAVAVCLSGCKIVSATPDTETVIDVRPGQTIEFKVSGPVNTPTSKCVWEVDKMNHEYDWPQYNTMLERSDTFKFTVDPDGGGTNRIRVRCVIYTLTIVGGPGSGCSLITGCLGFGPSASSRTWDIRILQDTAPVWKGNYQIRDSRDIELLKDYTIVSGSLFINGDDVINLEGIENLTSVKKSLYIRNNAALTSLSGLEGLTSVGGHLEIGDDYWGGNAALTTLGMAGLQRVGGYFKICYNPLLCTSLADELMNQILTGGGIGGDRWIYCNKDCTTP
jgi:hypothetical protein